MKTKLLRKLRKKAKKKIRLIRTDKYDYQVRRYYDKESYSTIYFIRGTWPLGEFLNQMYEARRYYILEEIKRMRNIYPKTIDI